MRKGDDLTTFTVLKVKKIRNLNLPEPLGPPRPVAGHLYLYLYSFGLIAISSSVSEAIKIRYKWLSDICVKYYCRLLCDMCRS